MIVEYLPALLALSLVIVAVITFVAGANTSDQARRSLINSIQNMTERLAALEDEDRRKWDKIRALERNLSRRESLLREIYRGSMMLLKQLEEAGIAPAWVPPESVARYYDHYEGAGVNTQVNDLIGMIDRFFDEAEIKTMARDLAVDYSNLEGVTKISKIASLVTYFERRGRLDMVIDYCADQRPGIFGWPII